MKTYLELKKHSLLGNFVKSKELPSYFKLQISYNLAITQKTFKRVLFIVNVKTILQRVFLKF